MTVLLRVEAWWWRRDDEGCSAPAPDWASSLSDPPSPPDVLAEIVMMGSGAGIARGTPWRRPAPLLLMGAAPAPAEAPPPFTAASVRECALVVERRLRFDFCAVARRESSECGALAASSSEPRVRRIFSPIGTAGVADTARGCTGAVARVRGLCMVVGVVGVVVVRGKRAKAAAAEEEGCREGRESQTEGVADGVQLAGALAVGETKRRVGQGQRRQPWKFGLGGPTQKDSKPAGARVLGALGGRRRWSRWKRNSEQAGSATPRHAPVSERFVLHPVTAQAFGRLDATRKD